MAMCGIKKSTAISQVLVTQHRSDIMHDLLSFMVQPNIACLVKKKELSFTVVCLE